MDEYSFANYDNFQESQHFSDMFMDDYEIQRKIEFQHQFIQTQDLKSDKDDTFATNLTCSIQVEKIIQQEIFAEEEEIIQKIQSKTRKIRKIETTSKIEILNNFTFSGSKNDTVELNTNFKTLFKNFIKQNYTQESTSQGEFFNQFERSVSSFKAFSQLYDSNVEIKEICSKLIHSSRIIKRIMNSRAKFWMRLQMIKYIEALNKNLESDRFVRWKSIRKQSN